MFEYAEKKERKIDRVLLNFMSELARYLIDAGISYPRFTSVARLAYFQAAASSARFSNKRLNQSAVAAMTGFTRVQIRGFAKKTKSAPSEIRDRIESVIEGWSYDRLFSISDEKPKKIRMNGNRRSFSTLAKKYGGDVPGRSLLREMQRHGYVTVRNGYVYLCKRARESVEETRARKIAQALTELLKIPCNETLSRTPARVATYEIAY
jgi:hypothetical protein